MKYVLIIIYLEGYLGSFSKQEKNFWQVSESIRIWDRIFKGLGFEYFLFIQLPKRISDEKDDCIVLKIVKDKINSLYKKLDGKEEQSLHFLITGDHDETKNPSELWGREDLAIEIKKYLETKNVKKPKEIKIILEEGKKFKIETLISEIIGIKKINKKILKEKYGTECPTIKDLFNNNPKENEIVEKIINNIKKSKHPLFKAIIKITSNIKNKVQ